MKITIELEASSAQEFLAKIAEFNEGQIKLEQKSTQVEMFKPDEMGPKPTMEEKPKVKKRPGRPAKKEEAAPDLKIAKEPEGATEETLEVSSSAVTLEACTDALKKISSSKGINTARDLLSQFDAKRISDVDPSRYGAFVAECEARLA